LSQIYQVNALRVRSEELKIALVRRRNEVEVTGTPEAPAHLLTPYSSLSFKR
jgi:hypothetical protein